MWGVYLQRFLRHLKDEEIDWKNAGDHDYQTVIARGFDGLVAVDPIKGITEVKWPRIKYRGYHLFTRRAS